MAEALVDVLIRNLRDYRLRGEAIRKLAETGEEAVGPLLDALGSETQEGARWAILRCLGELRAEQAVGHVAPLLDDRHFRSGAHDALVRIVGQDLGPAAQPWLRWARERRSGRAGAVSREPAMHTTGLPVERLMELALKDCSCSFRREAEDRYVVEAPVGDGVPAQEVIVNLDVKDHEGSPIVIVHTDCGPASPEHCEYALRRNLRMPYGALAIREAAGKPRFVMFNTLLRVDMSPLELRKSILAIAERAARVQQELRSSSAAGTEDSSG